MNDKTTDVAKGSETLHSFLSKILKGLAESESDTASCEFDFPIGGKMLHVEFDLVLTEARELP